MTPAITLTKAMADPALLGGPFQAASFWTWKTVAKLIDGAPLTEQRELELFKQCTGRTLLPNWKTRRALRRLIILCGRRAGKDRFLSACAIWRCALAADWRRYNSPGEQAVCLLLGADKRQAAILRRYCEGLLQAPMLAREVSRRTDNVIEFRNGSSLEIATNDARLVRGRSAIAVLGSECCYWKVDEASASSDEEVVAAATPSMAMTPDGGLLMLGSSVYRKRGYMYRQFKMLHGNDEAADVVWFASSRTMNPKLPQAVVDNALAADAPRARAEFENVWREDVDDFLPLDIIESCTDFGVVERPPERGVRYFAFADAASGTGKDSFRACYRPRGERRGPIRSHRSGLRAEATVCCRRRHRAIRDHPAGVRHHRNHVGQLCRWLLIGRVGAQLDQVQALREHHGAELSLRVAAADFKARPLGRQCHAAQAAVWPSTSRRRWSRDGRPRAGCLGP